MANQSSDSGDNRRGRIFGWILLPLTFFPLFALCTYDWHAIASLATPAAPSTNWIGPLGDHLVFLAYTVIGLTAWAIPPLVVILSLALVCGHRPFALRRLGWFCSAAAAASALIEVLARHSPVAADWSAALNLSNAGGIVGYLLIDRFLAPLVNDFGASVLMIVLFACSLVGLCGWRNLLSALAAPWRWAMQGSEPSPARDGELFEQRKAEYDALMQAKADAKAQARAEKEQAALRKAQAKAERERIIAERRAELEAARAAAMADENPGAATRPTAPVAPADEAETSPAKGPYQLPPVSTLAPLKKTTADHSDVGDMSRRLVDTLKLFGVDATVSYTVPGPVVTKYAIELAPGTRYSAVTNLHDNLTGALHATSLRIEAPIPGEDRIGIEVPNRAPAGISFREIFDSDAWRNSQAELPLLFGKRADGKELIADLASMPHMLVAGATGQGKSVCLNSLICGLLMTRTPEQLKLIMVDPKCVEFTPYSAIPHLLVPVITDNRKVVFSLHWAVSEMEKRLKLFSRARVRNIHDFNHRKTFTQTDMFGQDESVGSDMPKTVPYIVIIIDEAADLIGQCGKEVNPDIQRITQKARAAGIHLILATQRPDAKIITGTIKANIPGRVAFKTSQAIDSRTILDEAGAENLIGRGDMLFRGKDGLLIRAQGAWISDDEIANITSFIQEHSSTEFDDKFAKNLGRVKEADISDPFAALDEEEGKGESAAAAQREQVKAAENADLYKRAIEVIINTNRASISHFQRKLGIGYNHSANLCDQLEANGVLGPQSGAGPRTILLDQQQLLAIFNSDGGTAGAADQIAADAAPAATADEDDLFSNLESTPTAEGE